MRRNSERWLREHWDDEFVKRSKELGLRSRAAFKLLDIAARDRLLKPGLTVVDLGASPGGWSQVSALRVGPHGRVIAVDRDSMEEIPGVEFVCGDLSEEQVLDKLLILLEKRKVELVLSDMSPNLSGIKVLDQARSMELAELALDFSRRVMAPGGSLLVKIFQGEEYAAFVREMRTFFRQVTVRKPRASRSRSREVYLLGRQYGV